MQKKYLAFFLLSFLPVLALAQSTAIITKPNGQEEQFITAMVKHYSFKKSYLQDILAKANYNEKVIQSIKAPFEKKPWNFYRSYFVTAKRVELGVAYWQAHAKTLAAVKKKYGVDPSVIVAILGVETLYGKHIGGYSELDALSTLAFHYPPRSSYFTKELKQYLLLSRSEKLPITEIRGSYAGALGIPQFMPSSYRHYGVDFTGNKQVNLMNNNADAIASVANYLKQNGWQRNEPVATAVKKENAAIPQNLISTSAIPKHTLAYFAKRHILSEQHYNKTLPAALVELENGTQPGEYWFTFANFKSIMRYNPSSVYAMAVFQLSEAIKQAYLHTNTA